MSFMSYMKIMTYIKFMVLWHTVEMSIYLSKEALEPYECYQWDINSQANWNSTLMFLDASASLVLIVSLTQSLRWN